MAKRRDRYQQCGLGGYSDGLTFFEMGVVRSELFKYLTSPMIIEDLPLTLDEHHLENGQTEPLVNEKLEIILRLGALTILSTHRYAGSG